MKRIALDKKSVAVAVSSFVVVTAALTAAMTSGVFASAGEPRVPTLDEVVSQAQRQASDSQASILADGVVTWDEHESAIAATAACLSESGVSVEMRAAQGKRPSQIGFAVSSREEGTAAEEHLRGCRAEHLDAVDAVWLRAALPEDVERRANEYLSTCLLERGFTVEAERDGVVVNVFSEAQADRDGAGQVVGECVEQRRAELGY